MNRRAISYVLIMMFVVSTTVAQPPDTIWTKTYGGAEGENCHVVLETSDGGFILGGTTSSYGAGMTDMYLLKTDSSGDSLWSTVFGGPTQDTCYDVIKTSDGGFALAGRYTAYSMPDKFYLVKTDSLGNFEWEQVYGENHSNRCYSVQQTNDGGYILAGTTFFYISPTYQHWDVCLIKTDSLGYMEWQRFYGGIEDEKGRAVRQTLDGGYVIGGYTNSFGMGDYDCYLIKTDSSGNLEWETTYGGDEIDWCYSIQIAADRGYILGGGTQPSGTADMDMYLIKTDSQGNLEWQRSFGGVEHNTCYHLQQTADGGFILGGDASDPLFGIDFYVVKADSLGYSEWELYIESGDFSYSGCNSVYQIPDGGYILGGYINRFEGITSSDMFLVRLESDAQPINISLTPYNPPILIPATGGSFDFLISVSNNDSSTATFDVWTIAILPDSIEVGPILGPVNLTLFPGYVIYHDLSQNIPARAPIGTYIYNAYAGVCPDSVWDTDYFEFEKLPYTDGSPTSSNWNCWSENFEDLSNTITPIPDKYALLGTHPNPFNSTTIISYRLQDASFVILAVYDLAGRKVMDLVNGWRNAGAHEVTFAGSHLASGVYLYRIEAGDFTTVKKMVLMK